MIPFALKVSTLVKVAAKASISGSESGDPAENAALGLDHLQAHGVELRKVGSDAVFEHEAVVASVIGFAHRGVDADFRRYAGDDQLLDAAVLEDGVEVGGVKGALPRLVDHRLAWRRVEFGDDVVARFAAHQDAAHGPDVADAGRAAPAHFLGGRQIGEIGPVALARMHREEPRGSPRRQDAFVGLDRAAQLRDIVAEHLAESAGLEKVSLHIDDQKRAMVGRQFKAIGLGGDFHDFVHFRIHPSRRLEKGLHAYRSRALARFSARQRTFSSALSFLSNNRARMGG